MGLKEQGESSLSFPGICPLTAFAAKELTWQEEGPPMTSEKALSTVVVQEDAFFCSWKGQSDHSLEKICLISLFF